MKLIFGIIIAVLFSGLTTACVTTTVPAEKLSAIKTIAVVSDFDDDFHLYFYGLTVFDTEHEVAKISDWNLNAFVSRKAKELLGQKFVIVPGGSIDRSLFMVNEWTDDAAIRGEKAFAAVRDKNSEADAYLIIVRNTKDELASSGSRFVDNVGAIRRSIALRMPWVKYTQYGVYATYRAYLVDAKTGKSIASRYGQRLDYDEPIAYSVPFAPLESSDSWSKTLATIVPEHGPELEIKTKDMLARSLEITFQRLGLLTKS